MVVDFNGHTAGDILFERFGEAEYSGANEVVADSGRESGSEVQPDAEGVRRDSPEGGTAREETAGGAENCSAAPIFCLQGNGIDRADTAGCNGKGWKEDISYTLNTIDRPAVMAFSFDSLASNSMKSKNQNSGCREVDVAKTLDTSPPDQSKNQGGVCILDMSHACDVIRDCGGISPSLQARMGTGGNQVPLTFSMQSLGDYKENEIISSCQQRESKDATDLVVCIDELKANASVGTQQHVMERMVVRRLTPLECTRLQGFPDGWVDIGDWTDEKGRVHKEADAPKHKALGNSIALPFWRWMFERMAKYLPEGATLGSLFDGISGFNVCWAEIHGVQNCRWCSEIEPFPIAVTKKHFGDEENNVEGDLWNILEK